MLEFAPKCPPHRPPTGECVQEPSSNWWNEAAIPRGKAQRWELASLFDGSIIGDRIFSFCIESIAVTGEEVVSHSKVVIESKCQIRFEIEQQFRRPFRIPTASSRTDRQLISYSSSTTTPPICQPPKSLYHGIHCFPHVSLITCIVPKCSRYNHLRKRTVQRCWTRCHSLWVSCRYVKVYIILVTTTKITYDI